MSRRAGVFGRRALRSLGVRNFRLYFLGQLVSLSGTWMQTVAEIWLVLRLTGSGVALGVTAALQFVPVLVVGAWGGALADRIDQRRLIVVTQALMALPALALWALTVGGAVQVWMIFALVFVRGCINAVDNPTRRSFIHELVGSDHLVSAVSINSALVNGARIFGPAIAGVLIATVGVGPCFLINAVSFLAVIAALWAMDPRALYRGERVARAPGQVRAAVRYAWSTPQLRLPLVLTAVAGMLAFNFRVTLPLMAHDAFAGGAGLYGALTAAMGAGAIAGALVTAARARPSRRLLVSSTIAFGALIVAVAAAPSPAVEIIALVAMGMASIAFTSTANSSLQLASEPSMRGRVMALYSVVFLGSTPIGSPLMGWIAAQAGPRVALTVGGVATAAAGLAAVAVAWRARRPRREEAVAASQSGASSVSAVLTSSTSGRSSSASASAVSEPAPWISSATAAAGSSRRAPSESCWVDTPTIAKPRRVHSASTPRRMPRWSR